MLKKGIIIILINLLINTTQAQTSQFWGVSFDCGDNSLGAIFTTDSVGENFEVKYSFHYGEAFFPRGGLLYASNGNFYGCTFGYGNTNSGALYEYNPISEVFTIKVVFDSLPYPDNSPIGNLCQASNGKIYGVIEEGGVYNGGMLYEYDLISSNCSVVYNFQESITGSRPFYGVIEAEPGKLYGTLLLGGLFGWGVLYEYDIVNSTFSKKKEFGDIPSDGYFPSGGLFKASNNMFYGTTAQGGTNNDGVIFEYDLLNNLYLKKVDFDSSSTGKNPTGRLTEAINGKLYGVTNLGGQDNEGVLFEYNTVLNTLSGLYDFGFIDYGVDGMLLNASNGKLYGQTTSGIFNQGTVYEFDVFTNTYSTKSEMGTISGLDASVYDDPALIEVRIDYPTFTKKEVAQDFIEIYPNPTSGKFNIKIEKKYNNAKIELFNIAGKLIYTEKIKDKHFVEFNFELESGVYFIELTIDDVKTVSKLIKN